MEINNSNPIRSEAIQPSFLLKRMLSKLSEKLESEPYIVPAEGLKTQGVIREGEVDGLSYSIVARNSFSTNGRDIANIILDLKIKLPPGFENYEDGQFFFAATKLGSTEPESKLVLNFKKNDSGNTLEHSAHLPVYLSREYQLSIFEKKDSNGEEGGGERKNNTDPSGGGNLVRLKELHQPITRESKLQLQQSLSA